MGVVRDRLLSSRGKEFAIAFAAGAAALLASLANFLNHNNYPYFRPEVGLIGAGLLGFAAFMALWYVPQRQWGRSFLEGVLAAFFIDVNTDLIALAVAIGLAVVALTAWKRTSWLGPMGVLASIIFVTTVAGIGGRPPWFSSVKGNAPGTKSASQSPAILHLILDEHLGLEGMAYEGEQGRILRNELRDFYMGYGFAVYGGAYSQFFHSGNSIPFILNYGGARGRLIGRRGVEAGPTTHLKSLVDGGYRLTILQSDYADFCTGARFYECLTYDSSSLLPTLAAPMVTSERVKLIASKLSKVSRITKVGVDGWNLVAGSLYRLGIEMPFVRTSPGHSSSVAAMETVPILLAKLKRVQPGEAIVAHLLLPHHPYAVGRDCKYIPRPWQGMKTLAPLGVRRRAYFEQVRCAKLVVTEALAALAKSPAASNNVIIIHGDHGSRLTREELYEDKSHKPSDDDIVAGYSTLFAVRSAGTLPAYISRPQPVASLLNEFAKGGFKTAPPANSSVTPVVLVDWDLIPTGNLPLPPSWTKGLDRPATGQ